MKRSFAVATLWTAASGALLLSGCGGGGSGGTFNGGIGQPGAQVSGKAIDGYLAGAKVCLDLNRNGACDANEPSTLTGADGSYALPVSGSVIGEKLLVVVTPATRDLSRPGHVFPAEFTLSHILTDTSKQHVTPLTSLVAAQMEAGLSRSQAERKVASLLNGAVEVNGDYIAGKDGGTAAFASKVVDKVATFAINGKADHEQVRAVLNAITETGGIDRVGQAEVNAQARRPIFGGSIDAAAVLTSGLYRWGGLADGDAGRVVVPLREFLSLSGVGLATEMNKYSGAQWQPGVWREFDMNAGEYALKVDGGWSRFLANDVPERVALLRKSEGNAITVQDPVTGIGRKLEYRAARLDGRNIADVMQGQLDDVLRGQLKGAFAQGSTAYAATITHDTDELTVASFTACGNSPRVNEDGVSHCNFIGEPGQVFSSVQQAIGLDIGTGGGSVLRLFANGSADIREGGKVLVDAGKIKWTPYARYANALVIDISVADAETGRLSEADELREGGKLVIVLHNGRLKRGLLTPKSVQRSRLQFSPAAFEQFFKALKPVLGMG